MTHFNLRWDKRGYHIKVWIYSARGASLALTGTLIFDQEEWEAFRQYFHGDDVTVEPQFEDRAS